MAGAKCGSTFIDTNFKIWLQSVLGERNYAILDSKNASQKISSHATESAEMREVMEKFDGHKRRFGTDSKQKDIYIDLPRHTSLANLNIGDKIEAGALRITQ
jgi:hypothetical protein